LGKTTHKTIQIKEYIDIKEILDEFKIFLQIEASRLEKISYITLAGFGEPTLNAKIGELISNLKQLTRIPIAIITNSSLLTDMNLRKNILNADLIVPTLNMTTQNDFEMISRPYSEIKIEGVINGLINLRREFSGQIWLEIMIIKGFNDDIRKIKKLKEVVDLIRPNKIQLNSPVRAPHAEKVLSVEKNKLKKIKDILGENCEILYN